MQMRAYFSSGDIGAFFGVLVDAFSKISIIIAVLLFSEKMPADLVLTRILLGIALGSITLVASCLLIGSAAKWPGATPI